MSRIEAKRTPAGRLAHRLREWLDIALNIMTPPVWTFTPGPWLDRDHGHVSLPPDGRRPTQLVIFLHGVNGCGDAWRWMADVWRTYLPDAAIVFPDGLEYSRASPGMFQWWDLRSFDRRDIRIGLRRAAPRLQRFLKQVQEALGIPPEATILGGFSQGATLAMDMGARSRPSLAGVLAYSGIAEILPHHRVRVGSAPPMFLYHGTRDPVVPFSAFEDAGSRLSELGFEVVQWAAEGVDHTIDLRGAELAGELMSHWLRNRVAARDVTPAEKAALWQQCYGTG